MNWIVFAIAAYLAYALQQGLGHFWRIGDHEPLLPLILLVFIALQGSASTVAWAAILLGLLVDIETQGVTDLVGPWALGFLAAGYTLLQLRNLLFKDSVFTIAIMSLVSGVFAVLVPTILYAMRGIGFLTGEGIADFSAAQQLFDGFLMLVYTTALSIPVGWLLLKSKEAWGFGPRARGMR
ncbi:MAG: rod shape-determining protein MreD [Planctomycetota bacterium]